MIAGDRKAGPEILLAVVGREIVPDSHPRHPLRKIAVGTLAEIGKEWPTANSIIAVSITDAARTLRERANEHKIDISGFWREGE